MHKKLLVATSNPGKIREFRRLMDSFPAKIIVPADLGLELEVEETGTTYKENATLKARAYAREAGLPALADDSGLEVDALNGAPGLYSARYAPQPDATDADRRHYMLAQLGNTPAPRTARFQCVVAAAFPGGEVLYGRGTCEGEILFQERGTGGFGYDPIFCLAARGITMAELAQDEKNRLSHRALAVADILPELRRRFAF